MKLNLFFYCIKQSIYNIFRNKRFSLASIATVTSCIFLFSMFFSLISNSRYMVSNIESNLGITVLFNEDVSIDRALEIGKIIETNKLVDRIEYTSPSQAWDNFKRDYFKGKEALAEGFEDDNPLSNSQSYSIYINDAKQQESFVKYLYNIEGVRQVNYSKTAAVALSNFSNILSILTAIITGLLLAVSVFLISNTIAFTAERRKNENELMRLIGAENFTIRLPFILEGIFIGLIGSMISIVGIYFLYNYAIEYINTKMPIFSGAFSFMPIMNILPSIIYISVGIGFGTGFFASLISIRKHLKL